MKIAENIKRAVSMTGFKIRAHSPEILVVTGVIGAVVGTVMACKATMKLDDILGEAAETIERVNKAAEDETLKEKYSEDDRKRDLANCYVKTGAKVAKLYAPAAIVMSASVVSILTGHSILRKRNLALAAAYATLDKGFKKYRKEVVEKLGEAADREFAHGVKAVEVTDTVSDEKTGEPKEVKRTIDGFDLKDSYAPSGYAVLFDRTNPNWDRGGNMEYNAAFIRTQQQYANDLLRAQGHLFLNEVYEMLGFQPTKAGQVVGWIYDKKNPVGDNFVDFGAYTGFTMNGNDISDGYDPAILLDFNVDGNIFDRVKW